MERDPLQRIAEAISDGTPVDWEQQTGEPAHESQIQRLRLVESIAAAHRQEIVPTVGISASEAETAAVDGPRAEPMPRTWGLLEIRDVLGSGGFGDVYRAYDPRLDTEVALKLRRPDRAGRDPSHGRFLDEARKMARLRHPNVLVVHGADVHDGRVGLWTELIQGTTLEKLIELQGPLSAHEAALVGIELCLALAAVHGAGLLHRDVKTANVMRAEGGRIVLMDFGSVSEIDPEGAGGSFSGTPLFMAPEILEGNTPGPASDLYSLGVVLYRIVSGRYPAEADDLATLKQKLAAGFTPLRDARADLPPAFVQVVEHALQADPEKRYPSAGAMETALAAAMGASRPEPVEDKPRIELPQPAPHRRWAWAAGIILALVVGGWGAKTWLGHTSPPFQVTAALMRQELDGAKELSGNARLAVGDNLFIEVDAAESSYIYVINEDQIGHAYVLFPLSNFDLKNPVPSGRHRLPGSVQGVTKNWDVDSAGGVETFVLIASRDPLPDIEAELARVPEAGSGRNVTLPPESRDQLRGTLRLRGAGGIADAPVPPKGSAGLLSGISGDLVGLATAEAGFQVHEFRLENPIP